MSHYCGTHASVYDIPQICIIIISEISEKHPDTPEPIQATVVSRVPMGSAVLKNHACKALNWLVVLKVLTFGQCGPEKLIWPAC